MSSPATAPTVKPATDFTKVKYGLITKDGKLYDAETCGGHGGLARRLSRAGIVPPDTYYDDAGCVHVGNYDFDFVREMSGSYRRVTQQQMDTMFDYIMANGREFPFEILEVI